MDRVYRDLWAELHRPDSDDLRQHERDLLSHLSAAKGTTLQWLARHLLLPKSTASILVKDLERRGFVKRERRADNQRELSITLTAKGARHVARSTLLDTTALAHLFETVAASELETALATLEEVVRSSRQLSAGGDLRP